MKNYSAAEARKISMGSGALGSLLIAEVGLVRTAEALNEHFPKQSQKLYELLEAVQAVGTSVTDELDAVIDEDELTQ